MNRRKFQLCNGYLLEFDQLARVMNAMAEQPKALKITRKVLCDSTGLTDRHVEGIISIGAAIGVIEAGRQILSPVGRLIAKHDAFIEARGTLEWCHFIGAGSFKNLVWFEVFNTLLSIGHAMTTNEWIEKIRTQFTGEYSEKTLRKNLREEVRFVVDAYLNRHFKKLELLRKSGDQIYTHRLTEITPLVFAAIIYEFAGKSQTNPIQTVDLLNKPGSPGLLFAMDEATLHNHLEKLHEKGWLRYETTHNLNQARLHEGFTVIAFLKAHFEDKDPTIEECLNNSKQETMELFA